LNLLMC